MTTIKENPSNNAASKRDPHNVDADEEEEEEEAWIPLQPSTTTNTGTTTPRSKSRSSSSTSSSSTSNNNNKDDENRTTNTTRNTSSRSSSSSSLSIVPANSNNNNNKTQPESLLQIQRRLETQISIKQNFIDHPIDLFWKRYIINLFKELWELEFHIRLGLIMIITGISLRLFLLSTWFIWYPKIVFLTTTLIVSLIVLDPFGIKDELKRVMGTITTAKTIQATQAIEQLDMKQLRRLSLCLFVLPTILEIRTLSFLSHTIVSSSGLSVMINFMLSCCLFAIMVYYSKIKYQKPRECIYKGMLTLYGCAFFYSLLYFDIKKAPVLGAPFLTASGTLLLTYHDDDMEWIARVLRHALRLTLRDVLSSVSQKVSEDEMLQLAILRWIADYWATTCTEPDNGSNDETTSTATPPANDVPSPETRSAPTTEQANTDTEETSVPSTEETPPPQSSSSVIVPAASVNSNVVGNRRSSRRERFHAHEVQWSELLPMLNVATEHMSAEAQMLHDDTTNSTNARPDPNVFSSTNSTTNNNRRQSNNNTNNGDDDPFAGLREMLMSLDVDERGKPAVIAYRRAVESFPPDKRTALIVSVVRKCPAMLTVAMNLLFFGGRSSVLVILLLVPFVIMEYFRIRAWETCCKQLASVYSTIEANTEPSSNGDNDGDGGDIISAITTRMVGNADSMLILLCGDASSIVRPPTLLLVWHNIQGSVSALEVGLTAARCAQTSIVAAEFAGNVMSLMQLGLEVHEHGWLHGVAVLAKEFVVMHAHGDNNTKYTKAAIGAVENAKVVGRNVQSLAEDHDTLDPVLRPVVWTLRAVTGHGWLWGKDGDDGEANNNNQDNEEENPSNDGSVPLDPSSGTAASSAETNNNDPSTVKERECPPVVEEPLKHAKKSEAGQPHNAGNEEEDGLAEVMGMIASAYEQGLIDEGEKNSFCEKLSKLSKDEIQDAPIIKGMKQSLQIVLDNSDDQNNNNNKGWEASTKHDASEEVSEDKHALRSVARAAMASPNHDVRVQEESKPVTEDTALKATAREFVADDSVTTESVAAEAVTETATTSSRGIDSKDGEVASSNAMGEEDEEPTSEGEGAPLSEGGQAPIAERKEGRSSGGESHQDCGDGQQQESKKEEGENPWIQFGVAALGVVAGGLLLSMAGNENDSSNDNQRHRSDGTDNDNGEDDVQGTNGSTVVIEELSDDAEDDWVSIPKKSKD